ncbi:MAG: hypothetical protein AAF763_08505 [Pseudomonadota bacterium]
MLRTCLAAACAVLLASPASALPYLFEDAVSTFTGSIEGGFDYDPLSGVYASANIEAGGSTWTQILPNSGPSGLRLAQGPSADFTGDPVFRLDFVEPLNGDGQLTGQSLALVGACLNATCTSEAMPMIVQTHEGGVRGPALPPRLWAFEDASAQGIGDVEGSFVYDGALGVFSDIAILADGVLYDDVAPGSDGEDMVFRGAGAQASSILRVLPSERIGNGVAATPFDDIRVGFCLSPDCGSQALTAVVSFPQGVLTSRAVSPPGGGAEVPLPPAAALLLAGLAGLAATARRRA